ncbi:MAG: hypothetical protein J0M00_09985 [Burkholderiales bacterium]|nr:hypothetical protein [Burkholderiales bacterium]
MSQPGLPEVLSIATLLDHVHSHLRENHRIDELASGACMSPRHFALLPPGDRHHARAGGGAPAR